jgi:hypothetical protein
MFYVGVTDGPTLVVLAIVVLVVHMALDGYRMLRNLRFLRHIKYERGWTALCPRCIYIEEKLGAMRHEAIWTAAAVVALAGHITLDFVG